MHLVLYNDTYEQSKAVVKAIVIKEIVHLKCFCNSSSSSHVGFLFALFLQISLVCLVSSPPLWMKWSMWPKRWRDWGLQLPFWLEEPPHPSNNSAILTEWPVMRIYHCWMWRQSRTPSIIIVTYILFCPWHKLRPRNAMSSRGVTILKIHHSIWL